MLRAAPESAKIANPCDTRRRQKDGVRDQRYGSLCARGHPPAPHAAKLVSFMLRRMTTDIRDSIVVIEDHPDYLQYLTTLLRRAGYRVAGYEAATIAMRHLADDPASLIITDVFMPNMDGFEVLRELKRLGRDIPVIAVTGIEPRHARFLDAMRHMGARAGFTKPIDAEALLAAVAGLIGCSRPCS